MSVVAKSMARYSAAKGGFIQYWGCTEDVPSTGGGFRLHQCGKTALFDPDADGNPTRCGHHCAERRAKAEAARAAKVASWAMSRQRT